METLASCMELGALEPLEPTPSGSGVPVALAATVVTAEQTSTLPEVATVAHPVAGDVDFNRHAIVVSRRAEYVSATVLANSLNNRNMGIEVEKVASQAVKISSIHPDGIFHGSSLCAGDELVSVNGSNCASLATQQVTDLLASAKGWITIIARNSRGHSKHVESSVQKHDQYCDMGLLLDLNASGCLKVTKVGGLFAPSLLNAGDRIISINRVGCQGLDVEAARDLIRSASSHAIIQAETLSTTGVVVAVASERPTTPRTAHATSASPQSRDRGTENATVETTRSDENRSEKPACSFLVVFGLIATPLVLLPFIIQTLRKNDGANNRDENYGSSNYWSNDFDDWHDPVIDDCESSLWDSLCCGTFKYDHECCENYTLDDCSSTFLWGNACDNSEWNITTCCYLTDDELWLYSHCCDNFDRDDCSSLLSKNETWHSDNETRNVTSEYRNASVGNNNTFGGV